MFSYYFFLCSGALGENCDRERKKLHCRWRLLILIGDNVADSNEKMKNDENRVFPAASFSPGGRVVRDRTSRTKVDKFTEKLYFCVLLAHLETCKSNNSHRKKKTMRNTLKLSQDSTIKRKRSTRLINSRMRVCDNVIRQFYLETECNFQWKKSSQWQNTCSRVVRQRHEKVQSTWTSGR